MALVCVGYKDFLLKVCNFLVHLGKRKLAEHIISRVSSAVFYIIFPHELFGDSGIPKLASRLDQALLGQITGVIDLLSWSFENLFVLLLIV